MSLSAFLSRIADTKTKKLALFLFMGYLTFKVYRCLQQQSQTSFAKPEQPPSESITDTNKATTDEKDTESKVETVHEQKVENEVATELEVASAQRYTTPKTKGIPVSEEMLIIESAGNNALNGGYRWFLHDQKWCLFHDKSSQHFSLQNGSKVENVYKQMKDKQFQFDPSIRTCWTLTDIDAKVIYYAAAEVDKGYIPNDTTQWIVVSGTEPTPQIFVNLIDKTSSPDIDEQFGNAAPSEMAIRNAFRELDVENKGRIDRETMLKGFNNLGIELSMEQIRTFVMDITKDDNQGFYSEKEFCGAIQNWSKSIKSKSISFKENNKESDDNGNDNGIIVHKEKEDEEDEDSQISDLDA